MSGEVIVRSPYWSLAVAAGAGYLLGGGFLPRRLIGLLLGTSGQMAMTAVLRELISGQTNVASAFAPTNRSADSRPMETS